METRIIDLSEPLTFYLRTLYSTLYGAQRRAEQVMISRGVLATQTQPHRETSRSQSNPGPDNAASYSAPQAALEIGPDAASHNLRAQ